MRKINMISFIFASKEPVGSKPPTFSTELKSGTFEKHVGQDFALLCQAQAYPVPLIRLVLLTFSTVIFRQMLSARVMYDMAKFWNNVHIPQISTTMKCVHKKWCGKSSFIAQIQSDIKHRRSQIMLKVSHSNMPFQRHSAYCVRHKLAHHLCSGNINVYNEKENEKGKI